MIKNVLQSKRRRWVKIVHSLQERWIANWYLVNYWFLWGGGVVFFRNMDPLVQPRRRFPRWNPLFLQIFFKFCQNHSVEIGSNFFFVLPSLAITVPERWISFAEFSTCVTWGYRSRYTTRYYTKFPMGITLYSDFLPNVGLFDNLRAYLPENTWSGTSLWARRTSF